jgi:homoserine dehydrogenase
MSAPSRLLTVAIAGFGTVGRSAARLLCEQHQGALRLDLVCTRRPEAARRDAPWAPPAVRWTDRAEDLLNARTDIVVELIGGIEPARTWIAAALRAGRAVVTANKQVIAEHGPELFALARSCGSALRFEAAVGGAVPVIRGLQDGLAGDRVTRIAGVVNGTCNYVLGRMTDEGLSFDDAVREAQARGFAEADPAADLDGFDARAKLAILASIGFGDHVPPRGIRAGSIRGIDAGDIAAAASVGRVIRQVAWAGRTAPETDRLAAGVSGALVPRDSWLGRARGPENVVLVQGERSGTTVFAGQGAGGDATAVAVVSDLLALASERGVPRAWAASAAPGVCADQPRPHYVRVSAAATAAAVGPATLLRDAGIATEHVLAAPGRPGARWAALVRPCRQDDLDRALGPVVPAGGTDGAVISLPLFDAEP